MSLKLKALGLGLLAALSVSAFAVMNATAEVGGHFECAEAHCLIKGTEGPGAAHRLELTIHELEGGIVCDTATYSGTTTTATTTQVDVTPSYANCHTTGSATNIPIDVNGCTYRFTIRKGEVETKESTVDLVCPEGSPGIVITHGNSCTITVPPQNNVVGVTYTTIFENGKHTITVDANAEFHVQFHGGICVFIGTTHTGTLKGSATVEGTNTLGQRVNITAT